MYRPERVAAPSVEPVDLEQIKAHLGLLHDDDDDLLEAYLGAAVGVLDGYSGIMGRCLIEQQWAQDFDGFCRTLRLKLMPSDIVSVTWRNGAGQISTVASANYRLLTDGLGGYLQFKSDYAFPSDLNSVAAVRVTFKAGYGPAPSDVPAPIRQAIKMLVANWYGTREAVNIGNIVNTIPFGVDFLISPFRAVRM